MDFSRVKSFLDCPEKYRLSYNEDGQGHGLTKVEEDGNDAPLKFGSALHAGLDAFYLPKGVTPAQAFLTAFPQQLSPEEKVRTPANGLTVLTEYANRWGEHDRQFKVLAVEKLLTVDIGAAEPWEVKYDLIVEHPNQGVYAIEHKHTARREGFNDTYWRGFEPNSQVSGQVYGLLKTYGQCSGIFVNGISIGFNQRAGKRHGSGFWVEFERQLFNRSAAQLEDWRLRMGRTIARMHLTTAWEKNEGQCTYCAYRPLCLSAGDIQIRNSLYEVKLNPLEYMGKEQGA